VITATPVDGADPQKTEQKPPAPPPLAPLVTPPPPGVGKPPIVITKGPALPPVGMGKVSWVSPLGTSLLLPKAPPPPVDENAEASARANAMLKQAIADEEAKKKSGGEASPGAPSPLPKPAFADNVGGVPAPGADIAIGIKGTWDISPKTGKPEVGKAVVEVGAKTPVGGVGVKKEVVDSNVKK
jgi:hypothetical protein